MDGQKKVVDVTLIDALHPTGILESNVIPQQPLTPQALGPTVLLSSPLVQPLPLLQPPPKPSGSSPLLPLRPPALLPLRPPALLPLLPVPINRPLRISHNSQGEYKNIHRFTDISDLPGGRRDGVPSPRGDIPSAPSSWIYDIKYLVFSGGGVKGYAYAGAITALDAAFFKKKKNLYQQLEGMAGSSIGAMFALYVAIGVRGKQLIKDVMQTNIMELAQHMTIENLMDVYGLCLPTYFKRTVYDILERHMGKGDITFQELFEITQKNYVCCVTNITYNQAEYHSHETTPHYRVFESVAASMCIPLLFAPCIINGQCYVDGGMNDNCPFRVFPSNESLIFYLGGWKRSTNMDSLQQYIMFLAGNLWQTLDRNNFKLLSGQDKQRLVRINIEGMSMMDFHITPDHKKWLISKGALEVEKLLNPKTLLMDLVKLLVKSLCCVVLEKVLNPQTSE